MKGEEEEPGDFTPSSIATPAELPGVGQRLPQQRGLVHQLLRDTADIHTRATKT